MVVVVVVFQVVFVVKGSLKVGQRRKLEIVKEETDFQKVPIVVRLRGLYS